MSASEPSPAQPWMSPGLAIGLVIVSALSLLAFVVLNAFASDLRPDSSGGADALSKSAIGFAGLRILLEDAHLPVAVDRGEGAPAGAAYSARILTPEFFTAPSELARLARVPGSATLIILPKWLTVSDPLHPGWVLKADKFDVAVTKNLLGELSKTATMAQRKGTKVRIVWSDADRHPVTVPTPLAIESLQTLAGQDFDPAMIDDKGAIVLGLLHGTRIYVLADPDLLNTQGLRDPAAARQALGIIENLRSENGPVAFDVTLNGFRRTPDLLRELFAPPFLGATLCALLAAALIGYHAVSRFGTPHPPERAYAFGKRALADSTAGLIRILGREHAMAPRYAQALRNQALRFLGAPREATAAGAWLARAERQAPGGTGFAALLADAQGVENSSGLMAVAQKLYRWKWGITHGRR